NDDLKEVKDNYERLDSVPFDSDRKLMSAIVKNNDNEVDCLTKGAVDVLLDHTSQINVDGEVREITDEDGEKINDTNSDLAHRAYVFWLTLTNQSTKSLTKQLHKLTKMI